MEVINIESFELPGTLHRAWVTDSCLEARRKDEEKSFFLILVASACRHSFSAFVARATCASAKASATRGWRKLASGQPSATAYGVGRGASGLVSDTSMALLRGCSFKTKEHFYSLYQFNIQIWHKTRSQQE